MNTDRRNTGNTQAALHICNCCHRELPIGEFYINKSTGRADSYCKACRVRYKQQKRKERLGSTGGSRKRTYPVITQIENREERLTYIFHALQVVRESRRRKREAQDRLEDERMLNIGI